MEPKSDLVSRLGTFLIIVGIGLMLVFASSALGNRPSCNYFFLSLIVLFLGFLLLRRAATRTSSGRFGVIHRARERRRQRQEQKKQQQEKDRYS